MSDCTGCGALLISGIGEDERCYDCLRKRCKSLARRCNVIRKAMIDFRCESTRYMMLEVVAKHRAKKAEADLKDLMEACAPLKPESGYVDPLITLKETANHVARLTKALQPFAAGFPNTCKRDYLRAATALNWSPSHRCHECFSMCQCEAGRDDCYHCYIFDSEKN